MNKKPTYIIGTHSGHDASACLIKDNQILFGIAKERLTRKKHDSGEPIECIEYLLDAASLTKQEIDLVVRTNWFDNRELNDEYYNGFPKVISSRRHHDFHAWSTLTVMKDTPSLIVIIDGRGCRPEDLEDRNNVGNESLESHLKEFETESVYLFDGRNMNLLEKRWGTYYKNKYSWGSHIDSLGYAYAAVSKTIFGSSHAAGKVMALAGLGDKDPDIPMPLLYAEGEFKVNESWLDYIEGLPKPLHWDKQEAKDLAFSIQKGLEDYLTFRIKALIRKYGISSICLGGGTALNCKVNGILAQLKEVKNLSVFNACSDDGLSIGAAIWGKQVIMKNKEIVKWQSGMGRTYEEENTGMLHVEDEAALHLSQNKLLGLFSEGSEFGPRALGNRSILASPRDLSIKEYLNNDIKRREAFRPFGFAVLKKNLKLVTDEKLASPNMLSAIHLKPELRQIYPALLHYDETSRIQVIESENSPFGRILTAFTGLTGCPFLINTSFNGKDEPIVETPVQALLCAQKIQLDYVMIHNKLIAVKDK
jgi:carbamoyltransferase